MKRNVDKKTILKSVRSRILSKKCNSENEFENIQDRLNTVELELKLCAKKQHNKK